MKPLNLPKYEIDIRDSEKGTQIFDVVRKKYVVLTAEEWVRQHTVHYLINHKHVPRSLIKVESGLSYNTLSKRSDILVYDRKGSPFMLVECKSYEVKVNKSALHQASAYNKTLQATYVVVTNGMTFICACTNPELTWMEQIPDFPAN